MSENETRLSELEYVIIPGRLYGQPELEALNNEAFRYWKSFWQGVFAQNGCPEDLNEDAFIRQNMICILKTKNEIAGMHLYSFYNLSQDASLNHSYIKDSYNDLYIERLRSLNIKKVMSLEYLTVSPGWRKKYIGVSLGNLLVGLSGRVLSAVNYDASIAPSRSDVGVTAMACDIGGEIVIGNIEMHKTMCDLITIRNRKLKPHPDSIVNRWVEHYWNTRQDLAGYTSNLVVNLQKTNKIVA